jgi:hypothetical protein
VCFHRTPSHFQLFADFVVVTSLKQKVGNLLLPRSQSDRRIFHTAFPNSMNRRNLAEQNKDLTEAARSRLKQPVRGFSCPALEGCKDVYRYTRIHSIHAAKSHGFAQGWTTKISTDAQKGVPSADKLKNLRHKGWFEQLGKARTG